MRLLCEVKYAHDRRHHSNLLVPSESVLAMSTGNTLETKPHTPMKLEHPLKIPIAIPLALHRLSVLKLGSKGVITAILPWGQMWKCNLLFAVIFTLQRTRNVGTESPSDGMRKGFKSPGIVVFTIQNRYAQKHFVVLFPNNTLFTTGIQNYFPVCVQQNSWIDVFTFCHAIIIHKKIITILCNSYGNQFADANWRQTWCEMRIKRQFST